MRLIDADKLHYIRKWFEDSGKSEVVVFAREIDKQKEVEAIPIEWIRKWKERDENYWDKRYAIDDLLEDWEKENAKATD